MSKFGQDRDVQTRCGIVRTVLETSVTNQSTPTNGAMWAFTTVEGKTGAVGRRPVAVIRAKFSNSQQL